jgi:hypothetical protein
VRPRTAGTSAPSIGSGERNEKKRKEIRLPGRQISTQTDRTSSRCSERERREKERNPPLLLFFLFVVPVLKDSPSPSPLDFLFSPLLSFRPRSCVLRFALSFSPAHFACHGPAPPSFHSAAGSSCVVKSLLLASPWIV